MGNQLIKPSEVMIPLEQDVMSDSERIEFTAPVAAETAINSENDQQSSSAQLATDSEPLRIYSCSCLLRSLGNGQHDDRHPGPRGAKDFQY